MIDYEAFRIFDAVNRAQAGSVRKVADPSIVTGTGEQTYRPIDLQTDPSVHRSHKSQRYYR